jgi:nitroimidazol reductase NimA-like FMN-containing flavoprotein (pyridoxamine 5'-phosphate oxidase superfamily)
MTSTEPSSDRVRLRRMAQRGAYERAAVFAVLDAGLVAHVGVATEDGPIVLPVAYGRTDDQLYLHGSVANAALRAAVGHDICVTVTITEALIVGRSPFHNSMNYRCAVVRGAARRVDDVGERTVALRAISDHITATWDNGRAPTDAELRQPWSSLSSSSRCRRRSGPAIRSTTRPTSTARTGLDASRS